MKRLIMVILGICLSLHGLKAQEFSAFLSKNQVRVGETFQVSFRLTNTQRQPIDYPDFKDFQVLGGPNVSTQVQMINGRTSQSVTFSFYLRAGKKGSYTIGPASTKINGKKTKTAPLTLQVLEAQANNSPDNSGANKREANSENLDAQIRDALFLRTLLSKREVYQGEQITVTYKLYNQVQPYELELTEAPSYEGFWKENVKVADAPQKVEVYNNEQYRTRVIYQDIVFPQRPGKLNIEPLKLSCVIQVQTNKRQRRSIFDDFFPSYQNYPYKFGGGKIPITVKALPPGNPADFSGLVGKYNIDMSLDKTETVTGDPITVKVKLSGQGNFRKLSEPQVEFPSGFEIYDPNIKESNSRSGGILGGSRTYEYLIIPSNPGNFEIPPLTLSYFDPEEERYRQVQTPSYEISVSGEPLANAGNGGVNPANKSEVSVLDEDIRFIETGEAIDWEKEKTSLVKGPLYWTMYASPFLLLALLLGWKQRQEARSADVVGTRQRKATKVALNRLKDAHRHMEARDQKNFYNEVIRAIWGYVGDKLNMGQSSMSKESIRSQLAGRGASEGEVERLTGILDTCEMALFAPSAVEEKMEKTYKEAVSSISNLEHEISA